MNQATKEKEAPRTGVMKQTLSTEQIESFTGMTHQNVCGLFRRKELLGGKIGGRWRVRKEIFIEYLRNQNMILSDEDPMIEEIMAA